MPRRSEQAGSARGRAAGPAPDVFVPRGGVNDGPRHDDPVPLHRLDVPAPHLLPFAIGSFDTIGPLARANFPHRHSFHEIAYVTGGRGTHVVDLVRRPLGPPELSVIVPGQVHHWERVAQLHGWVILFTEDFLLAHPGDRDALATLGGCPGLRVSAGAAPRIASLVAEMVREYGKRADGFTSVLQAQLHILIAQALRLPGASGPAPDTGRTSPVAREFAALLARPGAAGRTVRPDAEKGPAVGSRALHEAREPTAGALCPAGPCAGPPDQRQRTPPDAALVTSPSRRRDWRESRRRSGRGPWARRSARRSRRYRRRPARWWSP